MDLPELPAPLLALLDESRDLARRMVEAAETAADAASLSALLAYRDSTGSDEADKAALAINRAAVELLARRLAIRTGAQEPDRVPSFGGATAAERQTLHRYRTTKRAPV